MRIFIELKICVHIILSPKHWSPLQLRYFYNENPYRTQYISRRCFVLANDMLVQGKCTPSKQQYMLFGFEDDLGPHTLKHTPLYISHWLLGKCIVFLVFAPQMHSIKNRVYGRSVGDTFVNIFDARRSHCRRAMICANNIWFVVVTYRIDVYRLARGQVWIVGCKL